MEKISLHEIKVFMVLRGAKGRWLTNKEIAAIIGRISPRTVRSHTLKFSNLGLVEEAQVFPGHRYRWSERGEKQNQSYCSQLDRAAQILVPSNRKIQNG